STSPTRPSGPPASTSFAPGWPTTRRSRLPSTDGCRPRRVEDAQLARDPPRVRTRARRHRWFGSVARMATRYDVTRDELSELLVGQPRYRVDQVWSGLYGQLGQPETWTNLPKALRAELAQRLP